MLHAIYVKYLLHLTFPAGTSRGILRQKETWFIKIWNSENPHIFGIGECALFRGLSSDDHNEYESVIKNCCKNIQKYAQNQDELIDFPSIKFGIETALLDLKNGGFQMLYPSAFTNGITGIPLNGLIWMGDVGYMNQQIKEKLNAGFRCLKFKVGALHLHEEMLMLQAIRKEYKVNDLEIRLDANGSFNKSNVYDALTKFAELNIHSIEQPIKPGDTESMAMLCSASPIPIALDEELIGKNKPEDKIKLLKTINPQYIIIKPALTGGFSGSQEWVNAAKGLNIGWWVTSALESNIGLNAIAQWTYTLGTKMTQGLGTGSLYANNIPSPLFIKDQSLFINPENKWDLSMINFNG